MLACQSVGHAIYMKMKHLITIAGIAFLSGCSCLVTSVSHTPVNNIPSQEVIDALATDSGFRNHRKEFNRISYKGALGLHVTQPSGRLEFVNGHCPVLPFWVHPGESFDKRWDDMDAMLKALEREGFPYRPESKPSGE